MSLQEPNARCSCKSGLSVQSVDVMERGPAAGEAAVPASLACRQAAACGGPAMTDAQRPHSGRPRHTGQERTLTIDTISFYLLLVHPLLPSPALHILTFSAHPASATPKVPGKSAYFERTLTPYPPLLSALVAEFDTPARKKRMHITVAVQGASTTGEEDILFIEVEPTTKVEVLKSRIEFQTSHPPRSQAIFYNGKQLEDDSKTMEQCEVTPDSMLAMVIKKPKTAAQAGPSRQRPAQGQQAQAPQTGVPDAETIRLQSVGNPEALAQLRAFSPELADAIHDPAKFTTTFNEVMKARKEYESRQAEREREYIRLQNADEFDMEAQARIAEILQEEAVEKERLHAAEYYPESLYGSVHMLYIPVEVNGHMIKAFVDSGAQRTVMSPSCAEKCGVMRLVDKRYEGMAVGVGTAKILGRVHSAQIKIGSLFLPCSLSVMEGKSIDLLLGLDMLKRYQASIDLMKGALVIQGVEVPFLGEAEIPQEMQQNDADMLKKAKEASLGVPAPQPVSQPESTAGSSSAAATGASQPPQPSSTTGPASFPPGDIAKLTELGASREEAIHLLEIAGGDVEQAAGFFLGG